MRFSGVNFHIYGGSTYATIVASYSNLHLFFLAGLNRTEPEFSDNRELCLGPGVDKVRKEMEESLRFCEFGVGFDCRVFIEYVISGL
jgi:hypothetical protein